MQENTVIGFAFIGGVCENGIKLSLNRARLVCAWFFCAQLSHHASAELTVIHDNGQTQPLGPYLEVLRKGSKKATVPATPSPSPEKTMPMQLPFATPELSPGKVKTRALLKNEAVKRMPAFFLIGTDPKSLRWLARNARRLKDMAAVGMLVEANTQSDLHAIAGLAAGLIVLPAPASDIALALNLKHVPVLVANGVIQQ